MPRLSAETRKSLHWVAVAFGLVLFLVLSFLFWQIFHAFVLLFAAILFAVFLDSLTDPLEGHLPMPRLASVLLVLVLLLAAVWAFAYLAGPSIVEQIRMLGDRLPAALSQLKSELEDTAWTSQVLESMPEPAEIVPSFSNILSRVSLVFSTTLGAVTNVIFILVVGFYLALQPRVYIDSCMRLLPVARRQRAREVIARLGHALRWWLLGRIVAMTAVGLMTALALWLADMPLPLALGFIAGLLSFVPYIGPIVSAVPAVLIALVQGGPAMAGYVIAIYSAVQFLEGNFITPVVQKYSVSLPPAVLIVGQFLMGIQFGVVGILLATPIAVCVIVVVQMLYIQDVLGDPVQVLGEHGGDPSPPGDSR